MSQTARDVVGLILAAALGTVTLLGGIRLVAPEPPCEVLCFGESQSRCMLHMHGANLGGYPSPEAALAAAERLGGCKVGREVQR